PRAVSSSRTTSIPRRRSAAERRLASTHADRTRLARTATFTERTERRTPATLSARCLSPSPQPPLTPPAFAHASAWRPSPSREGVGLRNEVKEDRVRGRGAGLTPGVVAPSPQDVERGCGSGLPLPRATPCRALVDQALQECDIRAIRVPQSLLCSYQSFA